VRDPRDEKSLLFFHVRRYNIWQLESPPNRPAPRTSGGAAGE
jgi:hypothetical protein